MSDELKTRSALAAVFLEHFGAEVLARCALKGDAFTNQRLAYNDYDSVRLYADVPQEGRGPRTVSVEDVGPFYMTDSRDLRDALMLALGLSTMAQRKRLEKRMERVRLWERD